MAWCWRSGNERRLIVVNLSEIPSQALVRVPWSDLSARKWRLDDLLESQSFERDGTEMCGAGLYVDLPPWGRYLFQVR